MTVDLHDVAGAHVALLGRRVEYSADRKERAWRKEGIRGVIRLGSPGVPVMWRICLRRACGWRLDDDGAQGAQMPTSGTAKRLDNAVRRIPSIAGGTCFAGCNLPGSLIRRFGCRP